jgi:SNF2 family DNA or RNA helicase
MQTNVEAFKKEPQVNVLLMPYAYGANGLNLIEATHVLLVEPTLKKSQEVQAIGRVHRIGQTKPTYVYRFLIRNTIEELVYSLFKSSTSYSKEDSTNSSSSGESPDRPNTSRAFAGLEEGANTQQPPAEKVITINDIKQLFLNL